MTLKENYRPKKGIFSLVIKDKKGNILQKYEDKNLIVNMASNIMRDLMLNGSPIIKKIKFGTKGVDSQDNVVQPKLEDTNLYETNANLIYEKTLNKDSDSNYTIKYSVTLEAGEANLNNNNYKISEAGLFTDEDGGDRIFSHKTFPIITKTSDRVFDFEWKITF